jgi:hypothetical protein
MVRAILGGRKTQTRRPFKFEFKNGYNPKFSGYSLGEYHTGNIESGAVLYSKSGACWNQVTEREISPYQPGDILYVRETFCPDYYYDGSPEYKERIESFGEGYKNLDIKWKPSIHMPKEAARIFLKVTDVRVERVQEITEEDAKAEGAPTAVWYKPHGEDYKEHKDISGLPGYPDERVSWRNGFATIWDNIYKEKSYGWQENPWVWVIEFGVMDI